jgi:hypothetical protein
MCRNRDDTCYRSCGCCNSISRICGSCHNNASGCSSVIQQHFQHFGRSRSRAQKRSYTVKGSQCWRWGASCSDLSGIALISPIFGALLVALMIAIALLVYGMRLIVLGVSGGRQTMTPTASPTVTLLPRLDFHVLSLLYISKNYK